MGFGYLTVGYRTLEQKRTYEREYYHAHKNDSVYKERRRATAQKAMKKWRESNPGYWLESYERRRQDPVWVSNSYQKHKDWKKLNPDINRKHATQYIHRRKCNGQPLPSWDVLMEIKAAQERRCIDCWEIKPLTIGHLVPLSQGGMNVASNIVYQCRSCNSKQGTRTHHYANPIYA